MQDDRTRYTEITSTKILQKKFMQHFDAAADKPELSAYKKFMDTINVGKQSGTETYADIGEPPEVRRASENRRQSIQMLNPEKSLDVANVYWDSKLAIPISLFEEEKWGRIDAKIRKWAAQANLFFNKMAFATLRTGVDATYGLCEDGQFFFDTDHADSGARYTTSQNNDRTDAYTIALFETNLMRMKAFKDGNGNPIGYVPNQVVVCPTLYSQMHRDLNSEFYAAQYVATGGTTDYTSQRQANPYMGKFDIIEDPYTTSTTSWIQLASSEVMKPINWQAAYTGFEFTSETNRNSAYVIENNAFLYQIMTKGNAFYGDWRTGNLCNA